MKSKLISCVMAFVVLAAMISGCSRSDVGDFEQVDFIEGFPIVENVDIANIQSLDIASKNITEIRVIDSLLIVSVDDDCGFWHVYSLPNANFLGKFMNVGVGLGELPMAMPCLLASFKHDESGHIIASVPAVTVGKMVVADLSVLPDSVKPFDVMDASMMPLCMMDYQLNDGISLRFNIDLERAGITRILFKDGVELDNDAMNVLNEKNVSDMSLISRLMTYPAIHPNGTKVAEIPGYDANINIWDVSGNGATSIIKKGVDNTEDVIEDRIAENKPIYNGGFGYNDFFTVQKINYSSDGKAVSVSVEFIDWSGRALGCININSGKIQRADIDARTGDLYLLDTNNDFVKRVNISTFLARIKA